MGRVMKKRGRRDMWLRLIILLILVAAGVTAYFLLRERAPDVKKVEEKRVDEKKVEEKEPSVREVVPIQRERAPEIAEKKTTEKGPISGEVREERRSPEKEDYCRKIENGVQDFFRYLDNKKYVKNLETDMDSYEHFQNVIMKLASQPPIPAGENLDTLVMTKNIYHFYRLLDQNDLRLIREIMRKEADSLEVNLDLFYRWLMLGEECPNPEGKRPSLEVLYEYAGFFLNTIGGRAYLYRRPLRVRLLVSYYSLLIVHEADKKGKNTYGIDIFPEITPLAREISLYPDFYYQNNYILQLTQLQNYYLKKR